MLPVPCDGPIVQLMQCDPSRPPAAPPIGEMHPSIRPYYNFICGMAVNEITNCALNNPVRMFCYNMAVQNNWNNQCFAEICQLICEYIQMQLVNNRAQDIQQVMHNAVTESVAAFSGYLLVAHQELKNYCQNDVIDMAYRSNEFFKQIKSDIYNYRNHGQRQQQQHQSYPSHHTHYGQSQQQQYQGRGTQQHGGAMNGHHPYPNHQHGTSHISTTPGNRYTRGTNNQPVQQQQQRHSDYSPSNVNQHHAAQIRYGSYQRQDVNEVPIAAVDDIEEIEASFVKVEDRTLAIADGNEKEHAKSGITMMGSFVPMDFEGRHKAASKAAELFTEVAATGEDFESIQEFSGILSSNSLVDAYTAMCSDQLETQGDKVGCSMYRAAVETNHYKVFKSNTDAFKTGLKKSSTLSQLVSFMRDVRDSNVEDEVHVCMVVDCYLTKRVNAFLKRNLQRTEWIDSVVDDWATILTHLTKEVSSSAASSLNRYMNDVVSQTKIVNEPPHECTEEYLDIVKNRIYFVETAVITRMFQYAVELGYKVKPDGCVIDESTAPILHSIAGSSAIYSNRVEIEPQHTYIVTADGVWYEIIYRDGMDEYWIYPAVMQML